MLFHAVGQPVDLSFTQCVIVDGLLLLQSCPVEQGVAGFRTFEQAMQVGAEDLIVFADGAVFELAENNGGSFECRAVCNAHVDLVTLYCGIIKG